MRFQGKVHVRAEIINPEFFGPRLFTGRFSVEEKHISLYPLRVENAGWKSEKRVYIAFVEEFLPDRFTGTTFKEHVIGKYDSGFPIDGQESLDVLEKVQLFIGCSCPKIITLIGQRVFCCLALAIHDGNTTLFPEWWVRQYQIESVTGVGDQGIANDDWTLFTANPMQE